MFCGLGEEERTRFRTKNKKEKKLIAAKIELVEMKWYLNIFNHVKYFLLYLTED